MKRSLLRFFGVFLLVASFSFPSRAADVPVTVRLSFKRADAKSTEKAASPQDGDAWIFVLDHSGSMLWEDAMVDPAIDSAAAGRKVTRWKALLAALKATLDQIEPGSVVQIVKVGGGSAELFKFGTGLFSSTNAVVVGSSADRESVYRKVEGWGKPVNGALTPLYQGLFLACQEAQRFIRSKNRHACIVVFSDGKNEAKAGTPGAKYGQKDIDAFKPLFEGSGFDACLNWVSTVSADLPPPPFGRRFNWVLPAKERNVIRPVCAVRPSPEAANLKNPLAGEAPAPLSVSWSFGLDPKRWEGLLAEGFNASVALQAADGTVVGGEDVSVSAGATSADVVFRVPEAFFAGGKAATFGLSLLGLPENAPICRFRQPPPVRLSFEARGAVSVSSVSPASGNAYKVGEPVSFSAAGTDGASFSWTFGDGASAKGPRVVHAFSAPAPKGVSFSVKAGKAGLAPAEKSGTVVVVEAGVKLDPVPADLKVGDVAVFSCRGRGEVASYDWFVDGAPAAGEDAADGSSSKLSVPLAKVGDHSVRVRANMKRVSPEETPDVPFSVAPAPFAAIVKPEPNERFEAESVVPLEASVEGGFASGVWTVRDASGAVVGAPVSASVVGSSAKANFPAPESGGDFAVSFVAGEGPGAKSAGPVPFSVKAKNVRLDVTSPVKDAPVRTGEAFELKAATAGLSGSVVFFLVDEATGAGTRIAEAKVNADGSAAASHVFPAKDGRGERTLVAKTADGKVVSDPVPFVLETDAGLVLKSPANNAQTAYGGSLVFEAEPSGAVSARDVQWFLRPAGGEERKIEGGSGAKYEHVFETVPNRKGLTYEVFARAKLPDGTSVETDRATVRASCPEILAAPDVPKEVAPGEEFSVRLKLDPKSAPAGTVVWNFGDGTTESASAADVVKHSFRDVSARTVVATVSCRTCREEKAFESRILVRCPDLRPVLSIDREDAGDGADDPFGRGRPIRMSVSYETPGAAARAADVRWDFGDGSSETNLDAVAHSFVEFGEKTVSATVRCSVCGKTETAKKTIRIDLKPPKAHFKVCSTASSDKPLGSSWVSQGSSVALVSTSTGDVAGLRWSRNGEPLPEFDDDPAPEVDCSDVGKQVFSLVVLDPAGVPSEPESHSVRVYRLWAIVLIAVFVLAVGIFVWWLYSGNDPRFWEIKSMVSENDSVSDKQAHDDFFDIGGSRTLEEKWSMWSKSAKYRLSDLADGQSDHWSSDTKRGSTVVAVHESKIMVSDGFKGVKPPEYDFVGEKNGVSMSRYCENQLVAFRAPSPDNQTGMTALWVNVHIPERIPTAHLWIRIALSAILLSLACAGCALFAF